MKHGHVGHRCVYAGADMTTFAVIEFFTKISEKFTGFISFHVLTLKKLPLKSEMVWCRALVDLTWNYPVHWYTSVIGTAIVRRQVLFGTTR